MSALFALAVVCSIFRLLIWLVHAENRSPKRPTFREPPAVSGPGRRRSPRFKYSDSSSGPSLPGPRRWSPAVTDLAEAIRRGESAHSALRDALLEDGDEELAERLADAQNEGDPLRRRGEVRWVLEQILDRE